jgi:hypothetical protein
MIPPITYVLLYVAEWYGRVIVQSPPLKTGDPVYLILGFRDNINSTMSTLTPLAFNLLRVYRYSLCLVSSQNHVFNSIKVYEL